MDLSMLALYNMRGNWDDSEPLALAPGSNVGFQQQQSPPPPSSPDKPSLDSSTPILAKQQQEVATCPLTTPAWPNLPVKEEPQEEKNNDSGISPGHYTSDTDSPHSDHSIAGASGLSPNSASSTSPEPRLPLDVNNVSNVSNTNESAYDYSRDNQQSAGSSAGSSGGSSVASSAGVPSPQDLSGDASMSPTQRDNDSNNNEGTDANVKTADESIEHPIVNSQGKVKTFRCKQCPFVAVTKRDFWTHTSSHIKPEKLLTCPKCPFVTEYKHHLEYHLRNHFGSKPYKCDKCNYSCVNKSMLNSHLKSHSNVYQFRCADCSYATKYCHSLKLHLRKYQHKPAMVLNADGTPNPLPIIDVYGTRRGPKAKPRREPQQQPQAQPSRQAPQAQAQQQQQQQQPPPPPPPPQQQQQQQQPLTQQPASSPSLVNGLLPPVVAPTLTPQFQFNAMNGVTAFNGFNGANALPVAASIPFLGFPYNPIFNGFPVGDPFAAAAASLAKAASSKELSNIAEQQPVNYSQQAIMNGGGIMTKPEASPPGCSSQQSPPLARNGDDGPVDLTENAPAVAPLDLSKPDTPKQVPRLPSGTSRRKGRAVKLDRRLLENDSDEEMPQEQATGKQPVATNVYMQLKHLRTDMQHMYRYICKLEENLSTRQ